jgi:regulatory protein
MGAEHRRSALAGQWAHGSIPGMARQPTILDQAALLRAAMDHLARRSDSIQGLSRALARKIAKAQAKDQCRIDDKDAAIKRVIEQIAAKGLLSDQRFAESRAMFLTGRGRSRLQIAADLAARGVDRETARAVLGARSRGDERAAAIAYARRRRLGPFRSSQRREKRLNDIAAMQRAGFDLALASAIIDADSAEALNQQDEDRA